MVDRLFPTLIAGVFLSAILAAIMSTADSQLLVTASAITEDFYKPFFRKNASDRELVWVSRGTVLGVAAVALLLAWNPDALVLEIVAYAWAGFGAAFGPVILLSLYWRRMNRTGALAGMITGGVTVLFWKQLHGGIFDLYEIVPGFLFGMIAIVIGSLSTVEPSKAICDEFDALSRAG